MNATEELKAIPTQSLSELPLTTPSDRRADIDAKQNLVADLAKEAGCDGLLVTAEENFAWLTAGAIPRGIVDLAAMPALYFSNEGRWLLCSNVDTQRLFEEELDGLGFQLKEWPWHWGRAQLLADLCQGRTVACDDHIASCKPIPELLRKQRRILSDYEQSCYRALGQVVSHALEATGRTMAQGNTEREVAGQLSHRLYHRGALPIAVSIFADGRGRYYKHAGFTSTPIQSTCVIYVSARKYGLCATATRSIAFGQFDDFRRDHDAACKVSANYVASSWPDSVPRQILASTQRIYQIVGAEHEWAQCPQGHVTGRCPVEQTFNYSDEDLLPSNCAITWTPSIGSAFSCDTFLITEEGPRAITAAENWPLKRIRIQGAEFVRPDVLVR
ncbi:MAG: aminopeptidase P family protein [Gemmataceae bacterium]|nr:aminopeptidase P family protein [Gemmataceae bacterium]